MSAWGTKLLVAASLLAPGIAGADEPLTGRFAGWVDIDAAGKVVSFTAEGAANPALANAVQQELRKFAFVPARRDSHPVAIRTYATGQYTLEASGDEYLMRVTDTQVGPRQVALDLPRPPQRLMTMDETGWARVGFVVGRDGKPRDVLVEEMVGPTEIRRNVRDSVLRWRFEPETVDAVAIETPMRVDFTFAKVNETATVAVPECPADNAGRVLAPGQTACGRFRSEMGPTQFGRPISIP